MSYYSKSPNSPLYRSYISVSKQLKEFKIDINEEISYINEYWRSSSIYINELKNSYQENLNEITGLFSDIDKNRIYSEKTIEMGKETFEKLKIQNDAIQKQNLDSEEEKAILLQEFELLELQRKENRDILSMYQNEIEENQHEFEINNKEKIEMAGQKKEYLQKLNEIQERIIKSEKLTKNITSEIHDLYETKKILNNQIQEKKGNIRVYCRIKPNLGLNIFILDDEKYNADKKQNIFEILEDQSTLNVNVPQESMKSDNDIQKHRFYFEKVFSESSNQIELFNEMAQLLQSVLDGYNVCIFAYGQTGSGKTFTMEGFAEDNELKGLIPRSVEYLYSQMNNLKHLGWNFNVSASFQEVYKEQILDPLQDSESIITGEPKQYQIHDPKEIFHLLTKSAENRKVGDTLSNKHSSRSHFVFQLFINGTKENGNKSQIKGTLNLIDLAGSERLSLSKAEGERMKETQHINKSLTAVGDVITALSLNQDHIPYRNSKLTCLLKNYLGGDSKTVMLVTLSPLIVNFKLSLCSLRFADKVKKCRNFAKKNLISSTKLNVKNKLN